MNKAFKVLWNQVRGSYVVTSEAQVTHGKPGKAVKTIVAAAVAGLMAVGVSAQAREITYGTIGSEGSTKFISGAGDTLEIKTNGDLRDLVEAIGTEDLDNVLGALGVDDEEKEVTLVGLAGGQNYWDAGTAEVMGALGGYVDKVANVSKQFAVTDVSRIEQDTNVIIGGDKTNPLLIATTAGDRVIGTGLCVNISGQEIGVASPSLDVTRVGDTHLEMKSGNSLMTLGGSSAINVGGLFVNVEQLNFKLTADSESTAVTLDGSTNLTINEKATNVGLFGGGSAIALGGKANSTVKQGSNVTINTDVNKQGFEGVTVGLFGGGLAASMMNGESHSVVNGQSTITIDKGLVVATVGGGVSAVTDPNGILDAAGIQDELGELIDAVLGENAVAGGLAEVQTDNVAINVGADATTIMLMGGNMALAAGGDSKTVSHATARTDSVVTTLNGPELGKFTNTDKGNLVSGAKKAMALAQNLLDGALTGDFYESLGTVIEEANVPGAHVANLGAGLAVAYTTYQNGQQPNAVTADSSVGTAKMIINGGYNVGNLGAGIAVGVGAANTKQGEVWAHADTENTTIEINGGENILTAAGGLSVATVHLTQEQIAGGVTGKDNKVQAQANVTGLAQISMKGGSADGLFGGGIAIDDTAAGTVNATANVAKSSITVEGGEVNKTELAALYDLVDQEGGAGDDLGGSFDPEEGIKETISLVENGEAAILGGGFATGGGAQANVESSKITLRGGKVTGNIFAGGAATMRGTTLVENAEIVVNGAEVNGNIYAGGLAGSERNGTAGFYNKPSSTVGTTTIKLVDGTVKGNIVANGFLHEATGNETASATVKNVSVELYRDGVFQGEVIDGSGATEASKLTFVADSFDLTDKRIIGFDSIKSDAATVTGLVYDFGENTDQTVVTGGVIDFEAIGYRAGDTLVIGDGQNAGIASINTSNLMGHVETARVPAVPFTIDLNKGLFSLNADAETALKNLPLASAEAALYVTGQVDLSSMTVAVGDVDAPAAGLYLGADGLLIADAAAKSEIKGEADTAKGKIHFTGVAEKGAQVTVAAADETATSVDNVLYKAVKNDNVYTFAQRQGQELADVGLDDFDDPDFLGDLHNHDNDGARFIEGFLDERNTGVTSANRSQQLNAAVNLATAAGVQTAAIDSATIGLDAANKRASMIHEFKDGGVLFAEASGRRTEMGGSADFGEIKAELGGVVVGGEYTTGDWTFGALANVGTGSVKGLGKNDGVENDVDYYGAQAYAAKRFGQFNVVGQLGYLATSNEISHSTVALNKADVDADVIMAGVRGEMRFDLSANTRLVPYVGFNYLRVGTDGYTTSQGVKVDSVDQNLFTVPVGVKYAGDMQTASGWAWTPSLDIGYVAAFGDRDVDAKTHVGAIGKTTMDVWAESVVRSSIGLKAQKDNFGIGVEAGGVVGSQDTTGLFGQIRVDYRF